MIIGKPKNRKISTPRNLPNTLFLEPNVAGTILRIDLIALGICIYLTQRWTFLDRIVRETKVKPEQATGWDHIN